MGLARAIANRPLLVVVAWILIAALAAPLFAKLHTVVKTQQYTLPESSEAMKAEKLLKEAGDSTKSNFGLVLVQGVNLRDNNTLVKLIKWGEEYNKSLVEKGYGRDANGLPIILAAIHSKLVSMLEKNISMGAEQARHIYEMYSMLGEAYSAALKNTTAMLEQLNNTAYMVAMADKGYAEAVKGFEELGKAALQLNQALLQLDMAYVNTTNQLLDLAVKLNNTAAMLSALDSVYAEIAKNVTASYQELKTVLSNTTVTSRVLEGLAFEWWQVSRTYTIMESVNGNYTAYARLANLSSIDPRLQPLPRNEASYVWRAVGSLVGQGYSVDNASLLVGLQLLANTTDRKGAMLARLLAPLWLAAAEEEAKSLGASELSQLYNTSSPEALARSQLQVLSLARDAAEKAAEEASAEAGVLAARALEEMLRAGGVPGELAERIAASLEKGGLDSEALAELVASRAAEERRELANLTSLVAELLARYDPEAASVLVYNRTLALEAAEDMLEQLGVPREVLDAAASLVAGGFSREIAAREALKLLEEKLSREKPEAAKLLPLLARYDPEAKGVIAENAELRARIIARVLSEEAARRGVEAPVEAVERLVDAVIVKGADPLEAARRLALELVVSQAREKAGEEAAERLRMILQQFDPAAEGALADPDKALEALLRLAAQQGNVPGNVSLNLSPKTVKELLVNQTKLRLYVADLVYSMAAEKMPEQARPLAREYLHTIALKGVPSQEELWRLIESQVAEMLKQYAGPQSAALAGIIVSVARNETTARSAAEKAALEIVLSQVAPKLLEEMKGTMVSKSLNGFTVMFTPEGNSRGERANNTKRAAKLAERLLDKHGLHATVLASGYDLLMSEVREYALKDAEKTTKISETATFIVLLLILESVFAVLMPYLGIALGLVVGGALVYIAAKQGWVSVDSTTQSLMMTTALGLGADYAAYIVHRFREEIARRDVLEVEGHEKKRLVREAAAHALERAGPAVLASALTVMIGFGSLLLGWDLAFLRGIGETVPVTVATTAAASLTLVPALLALTGGGRWFWWPRRPSKERHVEKVSRVMIVLHRHHRIVLSLFAILMLVGAYFYATFHGSHDMKLMLPENAEALKAFDVMKKEYMPGLTDPLNIVVKLEKPLKYRESREAVKSIVEAVRSVEGVGKVISPLDMMNQSMLLGSESSSIAEKNVVVIQVILAVDPYSDKGIKTIKEVHKRVHEVAERSGVEVYVGGVPYAVIEMDKLLNDRYYKRILPAAAILMILVFTVIFGSLPASVAAFAVIVGSAMLGIMASVIIFRDILGKDVPWFLHIVSTMAVLGVGMDYNSFFLARALEECQRNQCSDTEEALAKATGAVGLFIIGLALVVSSAYLSMLSASNIAMRAMGFTLGLTILLAGSMAGYLFTPLVIALLGEKAWWPWGMRKRVTH